tara:strand:- start:3928 stop:4659 length:732 start_codon:yes stop_codon:yes gene_type:complete
MDTNNTLSGVVAQVTTRQLDTNATQSVLKKWAVVENERVVSSPLVLQKLKYGSYKDAIALGTQIVALGKGNALDAEFKAVRVDIVKDTVKYFNAGALEVFETFITLACLLGKQDEIELTLCQANIDIVQEIIDSCKVGYLPRAVACMPSALQLGKREALEARLTKEGIDLAVEVNKTLRGNLRQLAAGYMQMLLLLGKEDILKEVIAQGSFNLETEGFAGKTLSEWSVQHGYVELARFLKGIG